MENEGLDSGGKVMVNADTLTPEKNAISYVIILISTTMMNDTIHDPWDGET